MTCLKTALILYGLDRPITGISRYTVELASALAGFDAGLQLTLLDAGKSSALGKFDGVRGETLPGGRRLPGLMTLGSAWIPWAVRRFGLDLVHDPVGVAPFLFGVDGARTVTTVHDVFTWSCPGYNTLLDTVIYRHWLPRMLPRVDGVITDSQVSKADILRYLKIAPHKVAVIYPGVSTVYRPLLAAEVAEAAARHRLPQGYQLYLGSVEKRKNVQGLLQAYALLRQRGEPRPLVVAGVRRSNAGDLPQLVEKLGLQDRVLFTGYIPDADLPAVYSGADLFVFPSLYEGFGLPPLEAMACGTPVVCSNAGSLPEVVGDAALMVDPHDTEGLAEAMHRVLADKDLQQELREKGLARAKTFTWEKTARETLAVYRKVLGLCQELPAQKP